MRLDAEALEHWRLIVARMPPMTDEQINAIAEILRRIDARNSNDPGQRDEPTTG